TGAADGDQVQDEADDGQDDADGHEDADIRDQADDEQNDAKDDHGAPFVAWTATGAGAALLCASTYRLHNVAHLIGVSSTLDWPSPRCHYRHVAISSKLLNEGERVIVSTRTHPKALIGPVLVAV